MLHTLKLLIPALIPSWNFFDIITPSPRIQYTLLESENETAHEWHEFRPRPAHLSFLQMLGRMLWNAKWNETMFVVGCAERLMEQPTRHSENEIMQRITRDLVSGDYSMQLNAVTHLQFRLLVVQRQDDALEQEVVYVSRIMPLPTRDAA